MMGGQPMTKMRRREPLQQGTIPGTADQYNERRLCGNSEENQLQIPHRPAEDRREILCEQCSI